ncbi:hypothetical protein [Mycolicibacterium llatzerense]|uniref:hypothetical protein n=1 Tax=Mycolicibacterium llatzerense TaxID=280871 RepID=UPI0013A701E2|nr:hypothetical protein [Mycolicibacterium llatzerense]
MSHESVALAAAEITIDSITHAHKNRSADLLAAEVGGLGWSSRVLVTERAVAAGPEGPAATVLVVRRVIAVVTGSVLAGNGTPL